MLPPDAAAALETAAAAPTPFTNLRRETFCRMHHLTDDCRTGSPVTGPFRTMKASMQFQEVVEAEGHLIDSHVMENIFDKVVEHSAKFQVEQFRIGKTNSERSYLRLKVEA